MSRFLCVCHVYMIHFLSFSSSSYPPSAHPTLCVPPHHPFSPPFFWGKLNSVLCSDNAVISQSSSWGQKSSAVIAVCLLHYLDSLKTLTFNSQDSSRIFMSSRSIVSIEWNSKEETSLGDSNTFLTQQVLAAPLNLAVLSDQGHVGVCWSTQEMAGKGGIGLTGSNTRQKYSLGVNLIKNLDIPLCCKLSQSTSPLCPFSHFHKWNFEPDDCRKYYIIWTFRWQRCDTHGIIFKLAIHGNSWQLRLKKLEFMIMIICFWL